MLNLLRNAVVLAAILCGTQGYAADQKHLNIGKDAFAFCMDRFPETKETSGLLKGDGWRSFGILGNFRAYSTERNRIVLGTAVTHAQIQGCIAFVHKMSTDEGIALIQDALKGAKDVKQIKPLENDAVAQWAGTWKGQPVIFGVHKPANLRIMRGAAISMISPK